MSTPARRAAIRWVILTIIFVHSCMAVTRITASLWVLRGGYGESAVGMMLSLFAVGPIFLSLWAGHLADRFGLHRPLGIAVLLATAGALSVLLHEAVWTLAISCLCSGGAISMAIVAIQREAGQMAAEPAELKQIFSWLALGPALSNALAAVAQLDSDLRRVARILDHHGTDFLVTNQLDKFRVRHAVGIGRARRVVLAEDREDHQPKHKPEGDLRKPLIVHRGSFKPLRRGRMPRNFRRQPRETADGRRPPPT
jgi:hypothetical protein